MITIMDCANAAQGVYKNEDIPGFFLKNGFYDPKNTSGFKAFGLFKVKSEAVELQGYSVGYYESINNSNYCIISVRGSAKSFTTKDWLDDDVDIGLGRLPDRTNDALVYIQRKLAQTQAAYPIIVGHSLGGFIAQYCGVRTNTRFITFNAPPALRAFGGQFPDGRAVGNFRSGLNYRTKYDPVSKAPGSHVGPLITLTLGGESKKASHKMSVVIPCVNHSGIANNLALTAIATANQ